MSSCDIGERDSIRDEVVTGHLMRFTLMMNPPGDGLYACQASMKHRECGHSASSA
jgi:hypothetical protein